jgi:hypothetical protein
MGDYVKVSKEAFAPIAELVRSYLEMKRMLLQE